jgi:hypothetical protein
MTFRLRTSGWKYPPEQQAKLEQLGFLFVQDEYGWHKDYQGDGPLKEFSSLADLMAFQAEWGSLVLDENTIEIYDDYRE